MATNGTNKTAGQEPAKTDAGKLVVTREKNRNKETGKMYNNYMIRGKIRGRDIKVDLMPPEHKRTTDGGGFEVFDIVFGNSETAEFEVRIREISDSTGAKKTKIEDYYIFNIDEVTGVKYDSPCIPQRTSDRSLLANLLREHAALLAAQKAAENPPSGDNT